MQRMHDDERVFRDAVEAQKRQGKPVDVAKIATELRIQALRANYLARRVGLDNKPLPADWKLPPKGPSSAGESAATKKESAASAN